MTRTTSREPFVTRAFKAGARVLAVIVLGGTTVQAQQPEPTPVAVNLPGSPAPFSDTAVRVLVGRSTLVDVGEPIARVSLTSADIADALVTSPSQLLVHGKTPGAISMFVWNRTGDVMRYEIAVQRDIAPLSGQVAQLFPGESIQVHSNGRQVILSGKVSSKDLLEKAVNVAAGYVEKKEDVVTLLQVQETRPSNQVLLRVRFAEVSRSAATEFGMSFFTSPTGIKNTLGRTTTQQYAAPGFDELKWSKASSDFGAPVTSAEGKFTFSDFLNVFLLSEKYDLGVMIRAMKERGLFQSLAEPNLVAESGKEASFLAGGEFPVPIAQGTGSNIALTIMFKEFGIRLGFLPTVNGDRIRLKVKPEVSSLDYGNAIVLQGFRIPSLQTRRAETELELRNGQTFAIAGLLNNTMTSTWQKVPGIGDIPILGHLFRSKGASKEATELVVMITPEILRTDSNGVTSTLPRLGEPFLPPVPENRSQPAPPPAFTPQALVQDPAPVVVTAEEKKAIERARNEARKQAEREAKAKAEADKAAARQARAEADRQREEAERQKAEAEKAEKRAREQAKRDLEAAARAVKEAARQARLEEQQKKKAAAQGDAGQAVNDPTGAR
jgi:pilus assembly protein CpaC